MHNLLYHTLASIIKSTTARMSFSRRKILKAASCFIAGATAVNAKKGISGSANLQYIGATTPASTHTPITTQVASGTQTFTLVQPTWLEKILNKDGTINWTEYTNVAKNYNRRDIIDYRFGPDYTFYHPISENIATIWGGTSDGFIGNSRLLKADNCDGTTDWFAMSGQLLFSPDTTAPKDYQPGAARARNGSIYLYAGATPPYCLDMRVQWEPNCGNYYSTNPDVAVTQQSWKNVSGGSVPAPPVATVRTKGGGGVTGFLIFQNGLIGATGTGNDAYDGTIGGGLPYPYVKLPTGKVPTAAAVTPSNEFLLVTVWDTINRKGQVAVVAIKGNVVTSNSNRFLWGFPSWPTIKGMKLLGYVDLPFAAPTAIQASANVVANSGRGEDDNEDMDLNSQNERNTWYNWSGSPYKKTASCGYAVVISRAEDKATFIDLQPLFQYYRKMYFTTQANYDQTKNESNAWNHWPYSFSYVQEQRPKVVSTISVKKPTAVVAGLIRCTFHWRDDDETFQENAYISTMDGELRIYKVGNLMTTGSATPIGAPFKIVKIGKNPTSIDYGRGADFGNDLIVSCRGDKTIYYLYYDGRIHASFRDSRLKDPVYIAVSANGRGEYGTCILSVMDFKGRQVVNYRYQNGGIEGLRIPIGNPPRSSIFEYSYATPLPGQPFMFTLGEVV